MARATFRVTSACRPEVRVRPGQWPRTSCRRRLSTSARHERCSAVEAPHRGSAGLFGDALSDGHRGWGVVGVGPRLTRGADARCYLLETKLLDVAIEVPLGPEFGAPLERLGCRLVLDLFVAADAAARATLPNARVLDTRTDARREVVAKQLAWHTLISRRTFPLEPPS